MLHSISQNYLPNYDVDVVFILIVPCCNFSETIGFVKSLNTTNPKIKLSKVSQNEAKLWNSDLA